MNIEPLETRIAPATLVNPTTVTYTDFDGDLATVKTSKGTFDLATNFEFFNILGLEQLRRLDLENTAEFSGANLTISAKPNQGAGDGWVDVGFIDASGTDLGAVLVDGDLGQIDAGDPNTTTPGLKKLTVQSMGRLGLNTQGGAGSLNSEINGALGALKVAGDVAGALVSVTGGADGKIGSVTISGSLIGGSSSNSGEIFNTGDMGAVKVGRDVQGGEGNASGQIHSQGKVTSISIAVANSRAWPWVVRSWGIRVLAAAEFAAPATWAR